MLGREEIDAQTFQPAQAGSLVGFGWNCVRAPQKASSDMCQYS